MDDFVKALESFFRCINQEYVPNVRGEIVTILSEVYFKEEKEKVAMEKVLCYLREHFPEDNDLLSPMEDAWQKETIISAST